jgi:RNA polymerase sigma-70 factor (ECF subfamily)
MRLRTPIESGPVLKGEICCRWHMQGSSPGATVRPNPPSSRPRATMLQTLLVTLWQDMAARLASASSIPPVQPDLCERLYRRARAERWKLGQDDFRAALVRSVSHRFRAESPSLSDVGKYLESLHVEDLALACACARGNESAWEHFVREFRPVLLSSAASGAPQDVARDVADSLYAELFGLEERDGARRSLFDYFHGRSSLAGWLRAVVAQRVVDWARTSRRFEPLPEDDRTAAPAGQDAPDVDGPRHQALVRASLAAAIGGLAACDRLRLALYYVQQMKLAAIGRMLHESEATVSRKLERTRVRLRAAVEERLRQARLTEAEIAACFEQARSDPAFDLARALPPDTLGTRD